MRTFNPINSTHIQKFTEILGEENVIKSDDMLKIYASDQTENLSFKPSVILKPINEFQISEIVKFCNQNLLPITPRAAGTGLAGGALPVFGGVVLSVEKLNQHIIIDDKNATVEVTASVINYHLQQELEKFGYFFPPDPSSWQSALISGNIATNAGGPKALKYGVTANYVLNLQVVLSDGKIIWTGANTLKNSTGYNITQLFVGSEGTLGIITKAVLRVIPKPKEQITLFVNFLNADEAIEAVNKIINFNIQPCALEFMEKQSILQAKKIITDFPIAINDETEACLLIMLDGNSQDELFAKAEKIDELLQTFQVENVFLAQSETEENRIWQLRRKVAEIVKANGYTIEEDTVVPRSEMVKLVRFAHQLAEKYQSKAVCYGHAGDGNLHLRFNHPTHKNSYQIDEIQQMLTELFTYIKSLGGTISGEHGIGLIQKKYLPIVADNALMELYKSIKNTFDVNGIMNPSKIID